MAENPNWGLSKPAFAKWYLEVHSPVCRNCKELNNLEHIIWACPSFGGQNGRKESWESSLRSQEESIERQVIGQARAAAEDQKKIPADV